MKVERHIDKSRSVRVSKSIEPCGFGNAIEPRVEKDRLVVVSDQQPRQGWEEAFRRAGASAKDDVLLGTVAPNKFDGDNWRW